jgi:hypothetical protein
VSVRNPKNLPQSPTAEDGPSTSYETVLQFNFNEGDFTSSVQMDAQSAPGGSPYSFQVNFLAVRCQMQVGQRVYLNVDTAAGLQSMPLPVFPQGTFAHADGTNWDVFIGAQFVSFVISPSGPRAFTAVRSANNGSAPMSIHVVGNYF